MTLLLSTQIRKTILFSRKKQLYVTGAQSMGKANFFTASENDNDNENFDENEEKKRHQLVWKADDDASPSIWDRSVAQKETFLKGSLDIALKRIDEQEKEGGRMQTRQLGVLREDASEDIRLLIENYTVPALASALRDREEVLQLCASLLSSNNLTELAKQLQPFERRYVQLRRFRKHVIDLNRGFDTTSLEMLRRGLMRMPRRVSHAHSRRAGVVLPLCNVGGVPCILFEKRSRSVRAHPDEVCLPGGMVCKTNDQSIVNTCLREMSEEIEGIVPHKVTVLGVLRCNWGEVAQITGVAVTPVVCFIGDVADMSLNPNADEVAECFTVPLSSFFKKDLWIHKEHSAPIFVGGPHIIWGLTGYIVDRFLKDVLEIYTIHCPDDITLNPSH